MGAAPIRLVERSGELPSGGSPTHGETARSKSRREYAAWSAMKRRCYSPNVQNYKNYGGRGIRVCVRWVESFEAFLGDMGRRPSSKHSLDRIDVNGHYEPANCRWATAAEQARNRRDNVVLEAHGQKKTQREWCRELGITERLLWRRLRDGLSMEQALSPSAITDNNRTVIALGGETRTLKDWSDRTGISTKILWRRIRDGWSPENALATKQQRGGRPLRLLTLGETTLSMADWAARLGWSSNGLSWRLARLPLEEALTRRPEKGRASKRGRRPSLRNVVHARNNS